MPLPNLRVVVKYFRAKPGFWAAIISPKINSQQSTVNSQQLTVNSQQLTVNS
ncbi:hypothetical protein QUB56_34080 [Microcoleus sp. AR_TQ3_B6]|uniref:hypothetical protein n=1 Tax=Microcoleus sp. AR_TQ3_B6 TaxID=3055284 RepID=UPI002FCEB6EE